MSGNPYQMDSGAAPMGDDQAETRGETQERSGRRDGKGNPYKSQMFRANIVLVGLFIAGAATVYGLTFRKTPSRASAEQQAVESEVEAAILRLANTTAQAGLRTPGRVTHDLLKNFYEQITERQVRLDALPKNPFFFVCPEGQTMQPPPKPRGGPRPAAPQDPAALTEEKVATELKTLTLQSVMMGGRADSGAAIISNNLLTVGQSIKCFTVKNITSDSVILECEGKEYTLIIQ